METDKIDWSNVATTASEPSTAVIPARVPTSDLTKEIVRESTLQLHLDDIKIYLSQYWGKELVPLALSWGFSIRENAPKSQAVDCIAQLLSMQNLDRAMAKRNVGRL
jgi:hypothetical protein